MARLIIKSPYIKCGGGQNASGYLQYIATRERVEIVPDDRPPTRKQEQLIQKLVKDFPNTKELLEYNDYTNAPTKANASSFITLTLEQNWSRVQSTEGYAKYIATRPRAERLGSHGLFGDADHVSLDTAMDELSHYTGNVWTHIISLKREDAMAKLPTVNKCYQKWWELQCQLNDYYSEQQRQRPPLSQQKEFRQIKNAVIKEAEHIRQGHMSFEDVALAQEDEPVDDRSMSYDCWELRKIIADENIPLEERDHAAAELEQIACQGDPHAQYLLGLLYRDGGLLVPDAEQAKHWLELSAQELSDAQYALGKLYLSDDSDIHHPAKGLYWLQQAADRGHEYAAYRLGKEYLTGENISKDTTKATAYLRQAAEQSNPYAQYLLGKLYLMGEGVPKDKDAAQYWFSVAERNGHAYAGYFLDRMERQEDLPPPNIMLSATRLLHHMGNIFRDNAPRPAAPTGVQIDHKRLQRLREKKMALGHKWNDHEEQQSHNMRGL